MSLRDTMTRIAESAEGGLAVIIMALDGIPIDEIVVKRSELDLQQLTVEYSMILKDIRRVVEVLKVGEVEEVTVTTGHLKVLLRVLSEELFAVLIMARDGNFGKGRYLLRLHSGDLARELC